MNRGEKETVRCRSGSHLVQLGANVDLRSVKNGGGGSGWTRFSTLQSRHTSVGGGSVRGKSRDQEKTTREYSCQTYLDSRTGLLLKENSFGTSPGVE